MKVQTAQKTTTSKAALKTHTGALGQLFELLPIKPDLVDELAVSIKAIGLQEPIRRLNGTVFDGRHRELACAKAGVVPHFLDIDVGQQKMPEGVEPVAELFVAQNLIRNHLSIGERALIAASFATLQKGSNQHAASAARFSRKALSATFAISEDTIDRGKVLLSSGRADFIDAVKRGASLSRAARVIELERHGAHVRRIASRDGAAAKVMKAMASNTLNVGIVLADPPWQFSSGTATQKGAPELHYPTMPLSDIKALPVGKLAAPDALCWLWVPNFMIPQGLEVLHAWGFSRYVTSMVWIKPQHTPTPGAVLSCHETLLIAARGQGLPPPTAGVPRARSWHQAPVIRHSQKPTHFADEIERLYPKAAKLELFARTPRKGWLAWGNEVLPKKSARKAATHKKTERRGRRCAGARRTKP